MTTNLDLYEKSYKRLNSDQKEAVDTIFGPVMVIAGPGTGKTTILSLRIAHILKETDTTSDSILAITFTDAGVISMRKKLLEIIGKEAHHVTITTFHGYCNSLIKTYPEYFPEIISSDQASESQIVELIEKIIDDHDWKYIKPLGDKYNYVWHIKSAIADLKKEGYTPETYKKYQLNLIESIKNDDENYSTRGAQKTGEKKLKAVAIKEIDKAMRSVELADFYQKFEEEKKAQNIYDYDDMILNVVEQLEKNEVLLATQQEKFQFILADEHQDSNFAQNKILEILTSFDDNPNLFIVGDEKQAIFRFQGASLENFLYFKNKFPSAKVIKLKDNYRSNQQILDASFGLIKNNKIDSEVFVELKSFSGKGDGPAINFSEYTNTDEENYTIVKRIKDQIASGVKPEEIAIIYRNHSEADDLARYLESFGVTFCIKTNKNLLLDYDIRRLRNIFRSLVNLDNDVALAQVLLTNYAENHPADVHKIINYAGKNGRSIYEIISDKKVLADLNLQKYDSFIDFGNALSEVSKLARTQSAAQTFVDVLNKFKILDEVLASDLSLERMQKINVFFNEVREFSNTAKKGSQITIEDFNNHLDRLERYNIEIKDKTNYLTKGVNLMTAHGSKGLEFDYVYIPHLNSKIWGKGSRSSRFILPYGNNSELSKDSEIDDERRLLFVAMTRARHEINLSFANYNEKGEELVGTIFIDELDKTHLNIIPPRQIDLMPILEAKFKSNEKVSEQDKTYLQELFLNRPMSVSALNNYLSCPWKYFYRNLVRIPDTYSIDQVYGNCIHAVVCEITVAENELKKTDRAVVLSQKDKEKIFTEVIAKQVAKSDLDLVQKKQLIERANKNMLGILSAIYYPDADEVISELDLHSSSIEFDKDKSIQLKGLIDHLVIKGDKMIVVDYKTGKPKTVNEIIGKTGDKTGDYYRQLVFYKMLLADSKYKDFKLTEARLQFMGLSDPEKSGPDEGFDVHSFNPTHDEVLELQELIKKTAREIYSLSFWDKKCNDKDCEFCSLPKPR